MPIPIGVAIGLLLAGTGVKMYEAKKTKKKVQAAKDIMQQRQDELSQDNRKIILDRVEDYAPDVRNEQQAALEQETADTLTENYSPQLNLARSGGKVTNAELTKRAEKVGEDKLDLAKMIALTAALRSPSDLRFQEAENQGFDAGRRGTLAAKARDYLQTDQLRLEEAAQGNSNLRLLGDVLSAVGMYGAGGAILGGGAGTVARSAAPVSGLGYTPVPGLTSAQQLAKAGWR